MDWIPTGSLTEALHDLTTRINRPVLELKSAGRCYFIGWVVFDPRLYLNWLPFSEVGGIVSPRSITVRRPLGTLPPRGPTSTSSPESGATSPGLRVPINPSSNRGHSNRNVISRQTQKVARICQEAGALKIHWRDPCYGRKSTTNWGTPASEAGASRGRASPRQHVHYRPIVTVRPRRPLTSDEASLGNDSCCGSNAAQ